MARRKPTGEGREPGQGSTDGRGNEVDERGVRHAIARRLNSTSALAKLLRVASAVSAPLSTNTGKEFACNPSDDAKCTLHLHGVTDSWGPFYSSKSSIGLVMATGNVGHHLSDKEDEVHTFFSRDGGLSWSMARAGSHIYEYVPYLPSTPTHL